MVKTDKACVESFNGRPRQGCLNVNGSWHWKTPGPRSRLGGRATTRTAPTRRRDGYYAPSSPTAADVNRRRRFPRSRKFLDLNGTKVGTGSVRPRASLHADGAGWQRRDHLAQPGTRGLGLEQLGHAGLVDAVNCEYALGQIDTNVQNPPGLPLSNESMRVGTSHRGTQLPVAATRLVRDGGVPCIR